MANIPYTKAYTPNINKQITNKQIRQTEQNS